MHQDETLAQYMVGDRVTANRDAPLPDGMNGDPTTGPLVMIIPYMIIKPGDDRPTQ
jgi:hypothetical protein